MSARVIRYRRAETRSGRCRARGRELLQHIDGGGIFFAFQHADVIAVDLGKMGKLLLRDRFLLSQPTQVPCDFLPVSSCAEESLAT